MCSQAESLLILSKLYFAKIGKTEAQVRNTFRARQLKVTDHLLKLELEPLGSWLPIQHSFLFDDWLLGPMEELKDFPEGVT